MLESVGFYMNVSNKQWIARTITMGALGSIAGAIGVAVYRIVVTLLQILIRGQHISRLSMVVSSFWVSAEIINAIRASQSEYARALAERMV